MGRCDLPFLAQITWEMWELIQTLWASLQLCYQTPAQMLMPGKHSGQPGVWNAVGREGVAVKGHLYCMEGKNTLLEDFYETNCF